MSISISIFYLTSAYYKGHGQVMIISIANTSKMMQFLHAFTISIKIWRRTWFSISVNITLDAGQIQRSNILTFLIVIIYLRSQFMPVYESDGKTKIINRRTECLFVVPFIAKIRADVNFRTPIYIYIYIYIYHVYFWYCVNNISVRHFFKKIIVM